MIQIIPHMKILLAVDPVDFRKGIDGLAGLCRKILHSDPFSGYLFVFINRRRTAIKVLCYDSQGFWLCQKRLSQGRFKWWPVNATGCRTATRDDIAFINRLIKDNPQASRLALSKMLCTEWNWVQPNGNLRDMIARGYMLALHRQGHITLPARKQTPNNPFLNRKKPAKIQIDQTRVTAGLNELTPLDIELVKNTPNEALFNSLIEHHHYLGYCHPVGEQLKYMVFHQKRPVACFSWSSAPLHIGARDRYIGWEKKHRDHNLCYIAYNSRFLILPWFRVPHLASCLLGYMARNLSKDWERIYCHPVYYLETFVDTELFSGTCYKASNWQYLGETTGRGKHERRHIKTRSIKAVWGYPLVKNFRTLMTRLPDEIIKEKKKGHGKRSADEFTGADKVAIAHETLSHKDPCPLCPNGILYLQKKPGLVIHFTGHAPINATIYETEKLRCNLCGEVFTAQAPENKTGRHYDPSAMAMMAILRYGCGLPWNRLANLQESMGVPLPASTQWEKTEAAADLIYPVFNELVFQAAQGDILHNDDTTMKILSLMKENQDKTSDERTGMFTTGIISQIGDDRKTALFYTGRNHAGENIARLYGMRDKDCPTPVQMCDALSRNFSDEFKRILCNCLTHARRNFVLVAPPG